MAERVELNPPWPWASQFRIAQGVQVGNTVYVSGAGSLRSTGQFSWRG